MLELALAAVAIVGMGGCLYLAHRAFNAQKDALTAHSALAEAALRHMKAGSVGEAVQAKFMEDVNKVTAEAHAKQVMRKVDPPPKTVPDQKGPPRTLKTDDNQTLALVEW